MIWFLMASFFFSGSSLNQESEQTKWNQKERNENKIEKKEISEWGVLCCYFVAQEIMWEIESETPSQHMASTVATDPKRKWQSICTS